MNRKLRFASVFLSLFGPAVCSASTVPSPAVPDQASLAVETASDTLHPHERTLAPLLSVAVIHSAQLARSLGADLPLLEAYRLLTPGEKRYAAFSSYALLAVQQTPASTTATTG
ncbi:hypothetical protein [Tahibacter amnicola]|uniref:Uncharacterized protein n=1 Tax=Tahibacter amnicola TaxID=2976241 RepID=A0ABY6B9V8_9GAMM|nr:hypothetical protein [Tahibacter amnicola]UXI66846.1 hypothetical protein N4264_19110 [Tahibacter amnicola]